MCEKAVGVVYVLSYPICNDNIYVGINIQNGVMVSLSLSLSIYIRPP